MTLRELIEKLLELEKGPDGDHISVTYARSHWDETEVQEVDIKRDKIGSRVRLR